MLCKTGSTAQAPRPLDLLQVRRLPHRNLKLFTRIFLLFLLCVQRYWTDYSTGAYVTALRHLHALQRTPNNLITALGILNFDSVRTDDILTALGPDVIISNQIQVV